MIKLYSAPLKGYANIEYFKPDDTAFGAGVALVLGVDGLVLSTTAPKYISLAASDKPSMEFGSLVAVMPIAEDTIYSAPLSVSGTALSVGSVVTLNATGDGVTATTESGIFQITGFAGGKAAGDIVYGKFVSAY